MYSKEEASKLREQFWITFGKYMKPIPGAEGLPINWVNYKTGVKHVFFRMNAEQNLAFISIEITQPNQELRAIYFEQFKALKTLFNDAIGEEWDWEPEATNSYGQPIAKISSELKNVSIYQRENWPTLISFLKPRIIALDQFWNEVKSIFEAL